MYFNERSLPGISHKISLYRKWFIEFRLILSEISSVDSSSKGFPVEEERAGVVYG